jgi:endonuclease/exonuclease/phosphatase family metal-dependent hydrolase
MMERSEFAPANWRMDQTEAVIRQTILASDPDFVLFQELPGLVPYIDTHDMVPANARGQSGDIATLVRRDLAADIDASRTENAVIARIKSADLSIANVHLPSGAGGDFDRLSRLKDIQAACKTPHLAIIGDTNTRTKEEESIGALGLVGARPPEATWNGRTGKFRRVARGYTAYFTRVFHSNGVTLSDQKVWTAPAAEGAFHISDHFALSGRLGLS